MRKQTGRIQIAYDTGRIARQKFESKGKKVPCPFSKQDLKDAWKEGYIDAITKRK